MFRNPRTLITHVGNQSRLNIIRKYKTHSLIGQATQPSSAPTLGSSSEDVPPRLYLKAKSSKAPAVQELLPLPHLLPGQCKLIHLDRTAAHVVPGLELLERHPPHPIQAANPQILRVAHRHAVLVIQLEIQPLFPAAISRRKNLLPIPVIHHKRILPLQLRQHHQRILRVPIVGPEHRVQQLRRPLPGRLFRLVSRRHVPIRELLEIA
mmetsp:Transcript_5014/g.14465  ORF Transcript_5014/g.14465 Transcript_5014/m.14465 type:complete len:208 (+) Transcript_5014:1626-2249(+)